MLLFGLLMRPNLREGSIYPILLMALILHVAKKAVSQGLVAETEPAPRSYLQPCEVVTLQTQCTEEEYESNEDCLPQKKDNCDRSKELYCHSGVCLSNCHPHKEIYDEVLGKCFRIVNSDCRSTNSNNISFPSPTSQTFLPSNDSTGNLQHSTVIVPDCVPNSVCVKGQCKCAKNFTYNHLFGRCMLTADYAGFCNATITCDIKSDISCKENQCQCVSPETQYFHLTRKRCYISLGEVCSTGLQFCPDNSNCVRKRVDNEISRMAQEQQQENGNAILFSSPATPEKKQVEKYSRLRELYMEHHSTGESEEEHFIGIWGGEDEEEKEFVCKCDKGYGSTQDKRFCLGLHGSRCNTQHRCNPERGLKCIDGFCLCGREKGNEQIFSKQFQTCITRVGSPCLLENGESTPDICPVGALCKEEKCVCDKGLTPGSSAVSQGTDWIAYSCMKSHGMSCKNNNSSGNNGSVSPQDTDLLFEPPCNHEIGLECNTQEGKCLCRDTNQFYDVRQRKCRNFQGIDAKIPVLHFTPPEDREYNFHRRRNYKSSSGKVNASVILTIFFVYFHNIQFFL